MTVFVVVHGIRAKPSPVDLRESCRHFLSKSSDVVLGASQVKLAYWADLAGYVPPITDDHGAFKPFGFRELVTIGGAGIVRKLAIDAVESRLSALLNRADQPDAESIVRLLAAGIGVLNDPVAGEIMRAFIRDVYVYFQGGIREAVKDRLREQLDEVPSGSKVVLIGHSLGSVVALDVLLSDARQVDWLLTLGSPLGFNAVQSKLAFQPEAYVALAGKAPRWHNLYDLLDVVSLDYDLADDFPDAAPNDIAIRNEFVYSTGKRNRHNLYGFLGNRETGKLVAAFLSDT